MSNYRGMGYRLPGGVSVTDIQPRKMMNDFTSFGSESAEAEESEEVEEVEEIEEANEFDEAFLSEIEKSHRKMG